MQGLIEFKKQLHHILDMNGFSGSTTVFQEMEKCPFVYDKATLADLKNDATQNLAVLNPQAFITRLHNFIETIGQVSQKQTQSNLPKILTSPPFQAPVFVGRQEELQAVHDRLFAGENFLMLVNGHGGIGKTTFASKYWEKYQHEYSHLAFLFVENGIANALLSLAPVLELEFTTETLAQQLEILVQKVSNLNKPCLLILDNANKEQDLNDNLMFLRRCSNFHILLTSRLADYAYSQKYPLGTLNEKQALELFKTHYPLLQETEIPLFQEIYTAVGGNTLVLELMAKNLGNFNNKLKKRYALQDLKNDLQKGLTKLSQSKEVNVAYQAKGTRLRAETSEAIILAMYDLSELSEAETALLSNLAVLPAQNIPFDILEELLNIENLDDTLLSLAQKGWIEYNEEEASFKVSPVVQEITKHKNKDRLPQDCQALLEKLYFLFENDNLYLKNISLQRASVYYPFAQAVFLNMPEKSRTLGGLGIFLGDYDNSIGNLMKARESFESAKAIFQEIRDDHNYGVSLQRLGESFSATGNLEQALKYYAEDRDLQESLYQENPNNSDYKNGLAISYGKLGSTHSKLGNLREALEFFEAYNRLEKELYEANPLNVGFKNSLAISYQYLGSTHSALGNLKEALEFLEAYNRLEKELYEANPLNVGFKNGLAISYFKLGSTHSELGNLEKALEFFEEVNKLFKELYEASPLNVGFKNGLAISYSKLGSTHSELGNLEKELVFFEEMKKLSKELYEAYPEQVGFKDSLAISYAQLGGVYTSQGNFEKALEIYLQANQLFKELYEAYPLNVGFKNGLAISYHKLGEFYKNQNNKQEAKSYFLKCEALFLELVEQVPNHKDFKDTLAEVQGNLQALT